MEQRLLFIQSSWEPFASVRLRDRDPPDRQRTIRLRPQFVSKTIKLFAEVAFEISYTLSVDAGSSSSATYLRKRRLEATPLQQPIVKAVPHANHNESSCCLRVCC